MKIEIKDNLVDRVIKFRGAAIGDSKAERERYKEAIAVMVDGLLRWALFKLEDDKNK